MQGRAHLCICCANTSVRRALRPFLNLPSPPILQPVGPAICAGAATLARAVLADGQNPTLPCLMAGDVGWGFETERSRKNPHERDHGDRAIGAFSGRMSGAAWRGMGVKNYTSISCHKTDSAAGPSHSAGAKMQFWLTLRISCNCNTLLKLLSSPRSITATCKRVGVPGTGLPCFDDGASDPSLRHRWQS